MNERILSFMHYHPVRTQRGLEIVTGMVPWVVILFLVVGSFAFPAIIAYFVIAFNVYWLYRCFQLALFSTLGYLNIKATQKIDWMEKIREDKKLAARAKKIIQVVMNLSIKEPLSIIERNLESLLQQNFPLKNVVVVLAMEDRAREVDRPKANYLLRKYKKRFGHMLVTWHKLAPGETIGKHSNEAYAAKIVKKYLVDKGNIPIENITITTCDVDTVFHRQYLSLLAYKFLTTPLPYNSFFQAPLFMHNNLHKLPLLVRLPAMIGGVYFLSVLQKYSKRFLNFSTYSLSLRLLDEVGYWDTDVIPEDAHLFFKCFFAKKGKISVQPLFLPVLIDAAESSTRWQTYKNTYQQHKRWAWGVVDVPYVVKNFFLHPEIPVWEKIVKISLSMESHFAWSISWFLITIGASIPTILNPAFSRTALGYNLSRTSGIILTICLIGAMAITFYDAMLNPKRKNKALVFLHPLTYLQWLFLPVTGLLFGSLPGLESQTRLMLGKYLEYKVTEKV